MGNIADQFRGLPIEDLIVGPLVGMAKGQAKLNEVTWQYINEVAFSGAEEVLEKYKDKDNHAYTFLNVFQYKQVSFSTIVEST